MDLDCFGSLALLKYIHTDYRLVRSNLIQPAAKNLYNLYQNRFNFLSAKDLKGESIEKIIIVDTRSTNRVKEYFDCIDDFAGDIEVFDHHPSDKNDIKNADIHEGNFGANTTLIGLELIKKSIKIEKEDATIALSGIYADTGGFQYENVTEEDFLVAAYLVRSGASLKLVNKYRQTLNEKHQIVLFHNVLNRLTYKEISGHFLVMSFMEIEEQESGLAAIVEKTFEIEHSDAIFSVFHFQNNNNSLIIARSNKDEIRVDKILRKFGGGGHERAASALVKKTSGMMVFAMLEEHLKDVLNPAITAEDIMVKDVIVIKDSMTLMEASIFLENENHTGAPVMTDRGELVGFMTLRDIMKGRKQDQMHSSVRGYMAKNVVVATKDHTIREVEDLFFKNNVGHLPVVHGKSLLGIITRTDYLRHMRK